VLLERSRQRQVLPSQHLIAPVSRSDSASTSQ